MQDTIGDTHPRTPLDAHRRAVALLTVLFSASCWGLSGTAAQVLFEHHHILPGWLVAVRMTLSGATLLAFGVLQKRRGGQGIGAVWGNPAARMQLVVFAFAGLGAVQYAYFAAIATGNAATATLLQYLGPSMVVGYTAARMRRWPRTAEWIALMMALTGTALLVTNGSFRHLGVPAVSAVWGIASAITLAFYTIYPVRLIKVWGAVPVVGWAMLIGGIGVSLLTQPWSLPAGSWTIGVAAILAFIVIFGTALPFGLYLASLRHLSPSETSLLASAEPLSASIAAVWLLHVHMGGGEIAGGVLIVLAVILIARRPGQAAPPPAP